MKNKKSVAAFITNILLIAALIYIAYHDGYRTAYWRGVTIGADACKLYLKGDGQ